MQPDWARILRLADKHEGKLAALLYQAFKQAQNNARARELITALLKGKSVESLIQEDTAQLAAKIGSILTDTAAGIMPQAAVIAAAGVVTAINAAAARGRSSMRLAADKNGLVSGKLAGKEFRIDLGFNMRNPLANQAISTFGADLVKQISDQTRQNIRNTLNDAFKHGGHPYEQARTIRNVVGLTELQAKRVEKFRDELVKTGKLTADKIDKLTAKYSDGIIRDRAKNIARTETMRAANAGQQFAWNAAFDKGLINDSFRKKWILTPDDRLCPVCASMEGKLADIKGKFDDPLGGKIEYPPLHPRCRCGMGLVESEEAEKQLQEQKEYVKLLHENWKKQTPIMMSGRGLPTEAEPFAVLGRINKKGILSQKRFFGENGRPALDVDYTNHGAPKTHPFVPHAHDWKESGRPAAFRRLTREEMSLVEVEK